MRIDKEHLKHSLKRPMTMTERLRGLVSKKNDDGVERKIDLELAVKANDDMDGDVVPTINEQVLSHPSIHQ